MNIRGILSWNKACENDWAPVWPRDIGHVFCQMAVKVIEQDFFCLHLVVEGEIEYEKHGEQKVVLPKGSVFTTDDRNRCRYVGLGRDSEIFWIRLKGPMVLSYFQSMGLDYGTSYKVCPFSERLLRLFEQCFDYVEAGDDASMHDIVSLLYRLAGAIRSGEEHSLQGSLDLARHVRLFMEEELSLHRTIKDFCYSFGVSRSTLYKSFQRTFGESPTDTLSRLRHEKSLELLKTTQLSIEEVAMRSGYSGYLQFVRTFKRLENVPPGKYRSEAQTLL